MKNSPLALMSEDKNPIHELVLVRPGLRVRGPEKNQTEKRDATEFDLTAGP